MNRTPEPRYEYRAAQMSLGHYVYDKLYHRTAREFKSKYRAKQWIKNNQEDLPQ